MLHQNLFTVKKINSIFNIRNVYLYHSQEEAHYNSTRMDFEIDQKPVTDHSILPNNLQPYCKGKNVYWIRPMEPTCEKEEDHGESFAVFKVSLAFKSGSLN